MNRLAFAFRIPPGHFTKFVECVRIYSEGANGVPAPPPPRRPGAAAIGRMAELCGHTLQLNWEVPHDQLDAFMDVLAWWMANTKAGAASSVEQFAFDLLERMREWRDRSVVEHIGEIPHE